jgi:hypothetical protein
VRKHKHEIRPNIFIRILMRYLINVFKRSGAKNYVVWGLQDGKNNTQYRLELGLDNGHTLVKGREKAIEELASTIYLADSSDYKSGLWDALRYLSPSVAEELENGKWRPGDCDGA